MPRRIAFAFFADVGDEENAAARVDFGLPGRRRAMMADEGCEAGAICPEDAGAEEASAFVTDFYVGWKGGRRCQDARRGRRFSFSLAPAEFADLRLPVLSILHFEAGGGRGESFLPRPGALGFLEMARRGFRSGGTCCSLIQAMFARRTTSRRSGLRNGVRRTGRVVGGGGPIVRSAGRT